MMPETREQAVRRPGGRTAEAVPPDEHRNLDFATGQAIGRDLAKLIAMREQLAGESGPAARAALETEIAAASSRIRRANNARQAQSLNLIRVPGD